MNRRLEEILNKNSLLNDQKELVLSDVKKLMNILTEEFDRQEISAAQTSTELEKLRIVMDSNPCTISWINRDLTYAGVNKTLADIYGVPINDFAGRTIGHHSRDNYFHKFAERLFNNKSNNIAEELVSSVNGSERVFWVMGTKFNQDQQAVVIGVDITEMNKLEDTVAFMEKLSSLGEMVAGIVHEVNNPLAAIKANAQLIEVCLEKNDIKKVAELGKKIDMTTDRISQIIRGIKSFVRRGDQDPHEEVEIGRIIDDAFIICEGKFKQKTVDYLPPRKNTDVKINCNFTEIFQVFVNLMSNSIDAIEKLDMRWVKITVDKTDSEVIVNFIDSGSGLPEFIKKNLFKSFYTTKEKGKGTGLGLSLCKKIIEAHGGTITVDESQKNTTFVIALKSI